LLVTQEEEEDDDDDDEGFKYSTVSISEVDCFLDLTFLISEKAKP
jgi:hypothetical protein